MRSSTQMKGLTVVILTFNEQLHIRRAIESAWEVAEEVIIVDSYSTDHTIHIALELNARVLQNPFVNQAQQFQWAMENGQIGTPWTMRLDADEYLTKDLAMEIKDRLHNLSQDISGVILKRQVHFMGQWIKYGGYYPIHLLRIWRTGSAVMEQKWMDEHTLLIRGNSIVFKHDFIDENLNSLTWWTNKHNAYATREAIDILSKKYQFDPDAQTAAMNLSVKQLGAKRWYKDNLYLRMPLFIRAFLYFQFRFWLKLGFLDGTKGLIWHFLQAFWYRFLVDAKIYQVMWVARQTNRSRC
jgi:glycosyltransferase involved in cell wall biosynthesis